MNGACGDKSRLAALVVGILGTFLIFLALVGAMWHFTRPVPLGADRVAIRKKALTEMRAAEAEGLTTYGWVDQTKGVVRLPIAVALRQALREWQNPAAARSNLVARVEKAFPPPPPPPPAKPSQFE